ncbi:MAG: hypothetical protein D6722_27310 [Bacteroidetes bacterium]|nr:MAG: hypothetical protein D6722_27310 [Bacteroidota bacterium]
MGRAMDGVGCLNLLIFPESRFVFLPTCWLPIDYLFSGKSMSGMIRTLQWAGFLFSLVCYASLLPAQSEVDAGSGHLQADGYTPDRKFAAYPSVIYTPETSFDLGITMVLLWHARYQGGQSRLNEVIVFPFYTLKKQYGLSTRHILVTREEQWFFYGRNRFQHFPLLYYGSGRQSDPAGASVLTADYLISQNRYLKRVAANTFVGLQSNVQWLANVSMEAQAGGPLMPMPDGGEGNLTVGLGAAAVYDSRQNLLNVREGLLVELGYLAFQPAWGSDFDFSTWNWDIRGYQKAWRDNQVLAWQLAGQLTSGDAPFNQLAAVGGESLLRGYYFGRFRDRQYVAGQVEMRWLPFSFSKRIGATAFLATGWVSDPVKELFSGPPIAAGGIGLRYLLFPKKDIFARLDMGITPEGTGFYIYLGEAF